MLAKRVFLLNVDFAMTIQDIISRVHLPSLVIMPLKYLKYFTASFFFFCYFLHISEKILRTIGTRAQNPFFRSASGMKTDVYPSGKDT